VTQRAAWVLPALLGVAITAYLSWGAWVSAHDPGWLNGDQWWRVWLRPGTNGTILVAVAVWIVAWQCYFWPRRLQTKLVGLITVVAMVVIGAVLCAASLVPCRGGQSETAVVDWILDLYVGNPTQVYGMPPVCPGQPPLALQLGQAVCLGATLVGAVGVAAALWRHPVGRLRARVARDVTVFTGLDAMTMPLLRRLAEVGRPGRIVVIEPDSAHPLIEEARATGARVMISDPTSPRVLLPVLAGWRGCALSYLYALKSDVTENEAVLTAANTILGRFRPDPERQPHLVARIEDPRHADYWRGRHSGTSSRWSEDALSSHETTAYALLDRVFRTRARQLVLCGDSTLALAILLELARRAWERQGLAQAMAHGRAAHRDAMADGADGQVLAPLPLQRVLLLDRRAEDLRREFLATAPESVLDALPVVTPHPQPWQDRLLAMLDAMAPGLAAECAVVVADSFTEGGMHEAGRVARLHPDIPVFVLTADRPSTSGAIFDQLQPFQRTLLVAGEVPEDTWTRVARHWHECYRLSHPPVPGDARAFTSRPWADLDEFIRRDNILQLRSIMTLTVARGRRWVPSRGVVPGSFIELNDHDFEQIARDEHTRWYRRRLAAGWSADGHRGADRSVRVNPRVVPWTDLAPADRAASIEYLRSQLAQLEDMGFMPIVPEGGPPGAAEFLRVGTVRARRLNARWPWTRQSGDELSGDPGDWRVVDDGGNERTVRDVEFRASHEPIGGVRWRRTGTYHAWQVSESLVLRTMEGRATAQPGDWVVEGHRGERWPVTDDQFRRTYQRKTDQQAT
jgi:hypothetical protein